MAIIMCAQLSISHNAFFFPPPRKAFLRPYIYHILQEALSGKQDSQAVSRRIVLTKSSRSTKAFCLKMETWRRSCFRLEGGIHSCWGFTLEKSLMIQMSEVAKWNILSCSAISKKQEGTCVSSTHRNVLGFPKDQILEMTEKTSQRELFQYGSVVLCFRGYAVCLSISTQDKVFLSSWKSRRMNTFLKTLLLPFLL